MTNAELARTYLDAVVARDYDHVKSLLADDFRLRDLSPPGFAEVAGVGAALSGLRQMFEHHLLTISNDRITAIDELCTGFFVP